MKSVIKRPVIQRGHAHRRPQGDDTTDVVEVLLPLHQRGDRHSAGRHRGARPRSLQNRSRLHAPPSPAMNASKSCSGHGGTPARAARGHRRGAHPRTRHLQAAFDSTRPRALTTCSCWRASSPSWTTARSSPATSRPNGKAAQDLHQTRTGEGDLRHHAVQPPAQHGGPQDRALDRHQQLHGAASPPSSPRSPR